jgi:hypothetical protein
MVLGIDLLHSEKCRMARHIYEEYFGDKCTHFIIGTYYGKCELALQVLSLNYAVAIAYLTRGAESTLDYLEEWYLENSEVDSSLKGVGPSLQRWSTEYYGLTASAPRWRNAEIYQYLAYIFNNNESTSPAPTAFMI